MKYELAGIILALLASPLLQPVYYTPRQPPTSLEQLQAIAGGCFLAAALALCVLGLVL